jgi:hypothetical protein
MIKLCCRPVWLIRYEKGNSEVNQEGIEKEDSLIFLKRKNNAI